MKQNLYKVVETYVQFNEDTGKYEDGIVYEWWDEFNQQLTEIIVVKKGQSSMNVSYAYSPLLMKDVEQARLNLETRVQQTFGNAYAQVLGDAATKFADLEGK